LVHPWPLKSKPLVGEHDPGEPRVASERPNRKWDELYSTVARIYKKRLTKTTQQGRGRASPVHTKRYWLVAAASSGSCCVWSAGRVRHGGTATAEEREEEADTESEIQSVVVGSYQTACYFSPVPRGANLSQRTTGSIHRRPRVRWH
jgi:hypothetical protein